MKHCDKVNGSKNCQLQKNIRPLLTKGREMKNDEKMGEIIEIYLAASPSGKKAILEKLREILQREHVQEAADDRHRKDSE